MCGVVGDVVLEADVLVGQGTVGMREDEFGVDVGRRSRWASPLAPRKSSQAQAHKVDGLAVQVCGADKATGVDGGCAWPVAL